MSSSHNSPTDLSHLHAPLLRPRNDATSSAPILSLLFGRCRRGPSMMVRETAARQLEERRADWGYSRPVVALDIMWNMAFVVVSAVMLGCTLGEKPNTWIRVWICGYAVQCLLHVVLVWLEYRRRSGSESRRLRDEEFGSDDDDDDVNDSDVDDDVGGGSSGNFSRSGFTKRCESLNTMVSFLWWIVGFYWVVSGGDILMQDAPRLYWLAVVFLAFDVFFAIFCVVLACLIGIALCCCLPCIIAILYAVAGQDGASESDLTVLPKYKFQMSSNEEKVSEGGGSMVPMETGSNYLANEQILLPEDAECCICLCPYEDGAELHALPCNHHFHFTCIVKWLKMNATCPLCKYNILKVTEQGLAVVFLAFDVFFAIFCVVLACLIGIALCCCLPCIIAILYAVAGQDGASESDLTVLPKYKFQMSSNEEKVSEGGGSMVPMETGSNYLANEQILLPEDAECCICLCPYEDGAELHALPCNHHFHFTCIVKWLKMNATCPLCKYNILKVTEQG